MKYFLLMPLDKRLQLINLRKNAIHKNPSLVLPIKLTMKITGRIQIRLAIQIPRMAGGHYSNGQSKKPPISVKVQIADSEHLIKSLITPKLMMVMRQIEMIKWRR